MRGGDVIMRQSQTSTKEKEKKEVKKANNDKPKKMEHHIRQTAPRLTWGLNQGPLSKTC